MSAESVVVSLLLCVGVLPLAAWLWRDRGGAARLGIAACCVVWIAAVTSLGRAHQRAAEIEATAPGRPIEVRSDGYTSSRACQACHPDQYASWHGSYHRTMTQVAGPESVLAPFDGVSLQLGQRYRLSRRGDTFWVATDDPRLADASGWSEHRVVLVTGSHHMQIYWFETGRGRTIARLPFFYRLREQRWIPLHAAFLAQATTEATEPGLWNRVCLRCHSTHSVPRWGDFVSMDTQVAELGIACESCHGPAEEHVRRNRNPLLRYAAHLGDGDEESIVNPARLDAQRSIDVCGRCHSVHSFTGVEAALDWSENGIPFRPGDDLSRALHVFRVGQSEDLPAVRFMRENSPHWWEDRFWPDGMVSIVGREYNGVRDSPCFAGGEFTCTSCHQLHRDADHPLPVREWANDQLGPRMGSDQACLQCHPSYADDPEAHTHHPAASEGSRCMNCHMPYTAYGLLQASRTHLVASPDTARTLATGRPNACNLCHLDQTLPWTAGYLKEWYGTPAPEFTDPDQETVADGVLWALRGHAGQRALLAWHMGWAPAREASGSDWMLPILTELLSDPYAAVRFVAQRSIRSIPGYEDFAFDYLAAPEERLRAAQALAARWASQPREPQPAGRGARVPLDAQGRVDAALLGRLLSMRDDRRIYRAE